MSIVSRIYNLIIFLSASIAWFYVKEIINLDSILKNTYISALAATLVIYIASLIFKNVSLYDTYWGLEGVLFAISYLKYNSNDTNDLNIRTIVTLGLTSFWSLRLVVLFAIYSWGDIYGEDWRYRAFRNRTNNTFKFSIRSLIMYYLLPMNIGFFGHIPLYYVTKTTNNLNALDYIGIFITAFGVVFEAIADYQLRASVFKQKVSTSATHSGTDEKMCMNNGLWSLCRHPNYFGEWLYWIGIYVIGFGAGARFTDIFYLIVFFVGPIMVYLVLNYVSIPLMEKRQLKRRADTYGKYMKDVKYSFFPFNF